MNDLTLSVRNYNETSAPERALVFEIRNQVQAHNARFDGEEPDLQALYRGITAYLVTLRCQYATAKRQSSMPFGWGRTNSQLELHDSRSPNRLILTVSQQ